MRPKTHPFYPSTEYKVGRKTHQVQEPMKRKICSARFHNFRQVEAANEFADFLVCIGTYAKKSTIDFF